jgi:hypothetical protein
MLGAAMSNVHWLDFNDAAEQTPEESFEARRERLRTALIGQLPSVLHHLFPSGKIRNGAFKIGGLNGQRGDSLTVTLRGEQAGLWQDFATGEGGDVFDLWAAAHRLDTRRDFAALLENIESWLGTAPIHTMPRREPPLDDLGAPTARWDYLDATGNLIACVYRYDTPDGKEFRPWDVKARRHKAPDPRPLYNQPSIASADRVVLVEGEKCADALMAKGICATTAMNGANAPIEKTDWSPLASKQVLIWPDNDEAGKAYALRAADALRLAGAASVTVLTPPAGNPPKWDAADAVAEGFDIPAFLQSAIALSTKRHGIQLMDWVATRYSGKAPERRYLVDQCIPMGAVTIFAAMGDTGKGMICLDLALKVSGCFGVAGCLMSLGGQVVRYGVAVVLTAEDDQAEVHRRLEGLDPEELRLHLAEKLIIVPLPNAGGPMALVQMTADGPVATPFFYSLREQLLAIPDLALVVIDPISCFFYADINKDPVAGSFATALIASLASETGAAFVIAHHMRKPSNTMPIKTPEQARDAIRGTTALVDGVRAAYAMWPAEEKEARQVCRQMELDFLRGRVFHGAVVKSNGPADRSIRTYVRDRNTGLLIDRTPDLKKKVDQDDRFLELIIDTVTVLARAGRPLTHTGANGIFKRRAELPEKLRDVSRHVLEMLVSQLLDDQRIVKCLAGGSKTVQWLDVPDGPFALGKGVFVEGASHASRSPPDT